jgi:nitrous oxidase accessory protein NosD
MKWNKMCGSVIRIVAGIASLALLLAGGAGAATLTVDDSGGANYTRIQDAIDKASDGDTIQVYSGTYYENVNVSRQLSLGGADNGGGKPVVDANGNGSAITLSAGNSTISGFTVVNSGLSNAGILIISSNNTIYDNYFNNTKNFVINNSVNRWNISKTPNFCALVVGIFCRSYLGGNIWANPNSTGFSQTCTDGDGDSICDSPYMLDISNIDYLPLTPCVDFNGKCGIDIGDVLFVAQIVAGLRTPTAAQIAAFDVNPIPGLDVGDVLFIAQAVAGLRTL